MSNAAAVTDTSFDQEVLQSDMPVLVDFWAEWCGPCRMISPLVDELAKEYEGKAKFTKVNVDDNPEISMKFNIRSIPTLLIFKGGKVVDQIIGAVPKSHLTKKLNEHV